MKDLCGVLAVCLRKVRRSLFHRQFARRMVGVVSLFTLAPALWAEPAPSSKGMGAKNKKAASTHAKPASEKVTAVKPMPAPLHTAQVAAVVQAAVPDPVITYFSQDTKGWLRAGETVHITMQGTPGGRAAFRIGTMTTNMPMKESSPGSYIGSWTVPPGPRMPARSFDIIGELRVGGKVSAPVSTPRPLCADPIAPTAQNLTPAPQATVAAANVIISADLTDQGSGIDTSAIHLLLNGRDITGEATIGMDRLQYAPIQPLAAGEQIVEITGSDRAGNRFRQTWRFTVTAEK